MAAFTISVSQFLSMNGDWGFLAGTTYHIGGVNQTGTITLIFTGGSTINLAGLGAFTIDTVPSGLTILNNCIGTLGLAVGAAAPSTITVEAAGETGGSLLSPQVAISDNKPFPLLWAGLLKANVHTAGFADAVNCNSVGAQITGNYAILNFSWTLDTPGPVNPGDTIQISSNPLNANHLKLNQLTPSIVYINDLGAHEVSITDIITQTEFSLIFTLPSLPGGNNGIIYIDGLGNGTQFSGSVVLGSLVILIENASGIYRIIADKTNDTLYVDSANSNTTANVKIPDPFAKTGFIGG
jgi:hypothetical protein